LIGRFEVPHVVLVSPIDHHTVRKPRCAGRPFWGCPVVVCALACSLFGASALAQEPAADTPVDDGAAGASTEAEPVREDVVAEDTAGAEAPVAGEDGAEDTSLDFLDSIDAGEEDEDIEEETEEDEPLVLPLFGETTFSLTNTTIAQYRRNNLALRGGFFESQAGYVFAVTEQLNLEMQGEELAASARIDAFLPFYEPDCMGMGCDFDFDIRPGPTRYDDEAEEDWGRILPERLTIRYENDDLAVELGDSHVVFGRGLALRFQKLDLIGLDATSRGGYVEYDGDDVFVRALGGIANPQNLDPQTLLIVPDPWVDVVTGVASGARLGANDELELGGHLVGVWFAPDDARNEAIRALVAGWYASAPSLFDGALALYVEANGMVREDLDEETTAIRHTGHAVYAQAQLNADDLSITLEWKEVRDFLLAPSPAVPPQRIYSGVPPLDRDGERFRGVHNSRGGALQVSYGIPESDWVVAGQGILYAHQDEAISLGRGRPAIYTDPWEGILVTHGVLQVQKHAAEELGDDEVNWTLDASVGYRTETYLTDRAAAASPDGPDMNTEPDYGAGDTEWRVIHGEVDFAIALGEHSFDLKIEHRFEHRLLFEAVDYIRGGVALTYTIGDRFSVTPSLRWNTERATYPTFYVGGEVRFDFNDESFIRLFGGQTPAGRICSGGVCRDVPAFEGMVLEGVFRI
jgi:hypothetical protein